MSCSECSAGTTVRSTLPKADHAAPGALMRRPSAGTSGGLRAERHSFACAPAWKRCHAGPPANIPRRAHARARARARTAQARNACTHNSLDRMHTHRTPTRRPPARTNARARPPLCAQRRAHAAGAEPGGLSGRFGAGSSSSQSLCSSASAEADGDAAKPPPAQAATDSAARQSCALYVDACAFSRLLRMLVGA